MQWGVTIRWEKKEERGVGVGWDNMNLNSSTSEETLSCINSWEINNILKSSIDKWITMTSNIWIININF